MLKHYSVAFCKHWSSFCAINKPRLSFVVSCDGIHASWSIMVTRWWQKSLRIDDWPQTKTSLRYRHWHRETERSGGNPFKDEQGVNNALHFSFLKEIGHSICVVYSMRLFDVSVDFCVFAEGVFFFHVDFVHLAYLVDFALWETLCMKFQSKFISFKNGRTPLITCMHSRDVLQISE